MIAAGLVATTAAGQGRLFHFEINQQPLPDALQTYAQVSGNEVVITKSAVAAATLVSVVGNYTASDALSRLLANTDLTAERSPTGALMVAERGAGTADGTGGAPSDAVASVGQEASQAGGAAPQSASTSSAKPTVKTLEAVQVTGSLIRAGTRGEASFSPLATVDAAQITAAGQVSLDSALGRMPQFAAAQGQSEVGDVQGATGFQGGQSYADLRGLGAERTLVLVDGQRLVPTSPSGAVDLNLIPMALIESVDVMTGGASATYGSDAMAGVVNFRLRQHFQGLQVSVQHGASTHGDGSENSASVLLGGNFADGKGNVVIDLEYHKRDGITGADRSFFSDPVNFPRAVPRAPEGIFSTAELGGNIPVSTINSILAGYPGTTPIAGTGNYDGFVGLNSDGTLFTTRSPGNCVQNYRGPVGKVLGLGISPDCTKVENYLGPYFLVQVPMHRYNLFSKVTYNINEDLQAYAQLNFMTSTAEDTNGGSFVGPGKFVYVPQNNPFVTGNTALMSLLNSRTALTPGGTPGTGPLEMEGWLTQFGPRIESFRYHDYQLTAGLNGWVGSSSVQWNVFGSYGQTNLDNYQQNNVNLPALETIMYGTANFVGSNGANCEGYAWNPMGNHPVSPGCLAYVAGTTKNNMVLTQKYLQGTVSGDLWELPAGAVKFAVGADYRSDGFNYQADPALNPAFNVMPSPIPPDIISPSYDLIGSTSGTQTVREGFAELSAPLLRDEPFAKELSLDIGARYSRYSRFGGVNTWKAGLRWQVDDAVAFRGGFNRAIRAPSLQELFNPTVQAQDSISGDPCEVGSPQRSGGAAAQVQALCLAQGVPASVYPSFTYGVSSANGIITGNPDLKPEVANTYTVGVVLTPHFEAPMARDLGATLDYYRIAINGAIAGVTLDSVIQDCFNANNANPSYTESNTFCQRITRDPTTGDITLGRESSENIGSYVSEGADIEAHWGFQLHDLGLPISGRVKLQTFISYLRSLRVSGVPGVADLNYAGSVGDTNTAMAADGTSISDLSHPRWKAITTLGYSDGPWSAALRWRYISGMTDLMDGVGSGDQGVPAYNYFDLDGHWEVTHDVELSAGVTNLTDKAPPRIAGAAFLTDAATYDIVGRTYFVGVKAKL